MSEGKLYSVAGIVHVENLPGLSLRMLRRERGFDGC